MHVARSRLADLVGLHVPTSRSWRTAFRVLHKYSNDASNFAALTHFVMKSVGFSGSGTKPSSTSPLARRSVNVLYRRRQCLSLGGGLGGFGGGGGVGGGVAP